MAAYLPGWLAGWLRAGLGLLHGLAAWLALAAWLPGFAFAFGFGLGFVGLDCAGLGWAKPTKPFLVNYKHLLWNPRWLAGVGRKIAAGPVASSDP